MTPPRDILTWRGLQMAALKSRVVEVEGLLEGMHSSARIHGEEADAAITALKVGVSATL